MDYIDQPGGNRARIFIPEEQEIIVNVYKYVQSSWPHNHWSPSDTDSNDNSAEATSLRPSRRARDRKSRRHLLSDMMDEETLETLKSKIYSFFQEVGHGVPTPENILREINEDESLPNFGMSTFRRILRRLKYRHYVTRNRHDADNRCEAFSIPMM